MKTVSGDVRATNVRGELRAESVSGDVTTTAVRRLGAVKSVSGDIQISDAESTDQVAVATVSGDLLIRRLKAREIDMNTVSGDMRSDYALTLSGNQLDTGGRGRRRGPNRPMRGSFGDAGAILSLRSFSGDIAITKR